MTRKQCETGMLKSYGYRNEFIAQKRLRFYQRQDLPRIRNSIVCELAQKMRFRIGDSECAMPRTQQQGQGLLSRSYFLN